MEAGSIQSLVVALTLPILALVLFLPHAGVRGGSCCWRHPARFPQRPYWRRPLFALCTVDLTRLGEASNLSQRLLVRPYFIHAMQQSPWVGWGMGAGKIIIPRDAHIAHLLGTNVAHNKYLRIGAEGGFLGAGLLITLTALWAVHGSRPLPPRGDGS